MTPLRWTYFLSSSTDSPPPQPRRTLNPHDRPSTRCNQHTIDARSQLSFSSTAANSQSSASSTALVPEQAVLATSRALAHAHLAHTTMTSPDDDYASTSTDDSVVPEVIYTAMVTKNEGPEERAPVQAVAEVAPTSPATAAFLDTPIDSKPLPHTTPQSEQAEPSLNSHMSIATVDRDPGSLSGSPTMDVGSPEGAPPRVDLQAQTTSVLQGDIEMASQPQYDVRMDSQPQDKKLVGHMSPVKLRSILDPNTKMRTPPPATPPPSKDAAAIDAGPNGATPESATALLTPASTAPPSDRASSPIAPFFANFDSQRKGAIHQHYRRARIFPKTRELMYSFSGKMLVVASRGFGRGRLPTRQTKPPLLKRRHSIDVNTTNSWGTWWAANFKAPEIEVRLIRIARLSSFVSAIH
jgi:hypothetical protein